MKFINLYKKNIIKSLENISEDKIISVIKLLADICSVEWNDGALSAPNFQANLEKSKKYFLCSGGHFKNRLEQLVRDVRSDVMNS